MRAVGVVAWAVLVAGCAPFTPPPDRSSTQTAAAPTTPEVPTPTVSESASGGSATAAQAIAVFANGYINWTAATIAGDMRALAASSIGQARSVAALAAAQTANDYELQRGGIANSGTVEAIAPLPGHRDQYVVVTRERTIATNTSAYDGLAPGWHVALATVSELEPGRWVVSGWQPES